MICQNCGTQIIDGAKFCQKCGAPCGTPKEPQEDVQKPKKKKKKILIIIISLILVVAIAVSAVIFVPKFLNKKDEDNTPYVTGIKMSDDLFDFTFKLDGSVLSIPCKYEDLSNCGWEISDDDYSKDTVLSPGDNVGFDMSKNDSTITFYSYNPTNKEMPLEDCPVGSVEITADDDIDFSIAKGISIDSTAKEVEDAFGKAERNYEDDSEFTITYKLNNSNYTYTDFHFADETECDRITLRNLIEKTAAKEPNNTEEVQLLEATESDFDALMDTYYYWLYKSDSFDSASLTAQETLENYIVPEVCAIGLYSSVYDTPEQEYADAHTHTDPKNKLAPDYETFSKDPDKYWYSYGKFDAENVDFLLENIMNVTPDHNYVSEQSYYYDGYYYCNTGDGGDGIYEGSVISTELTDDGKNKIEIGITDYSGNSLGTMTVVAAIKEVDGKRIWSFYSYESPFEYNNY